MVNTVLSRNGGVISLCILLPLFIGYIKCASTESEPGVDVPAEVIVVTDDQHHTLKSPDFPKCCKPHKYLLMKGRADAKKYWKLVFTDLDLPPFSQLLIYGIKTDGAEKEPIVAARYRILKSTWIRPVVVYEGHAISIEFRPAQTGKAKSSNSKYVGFQATYWLDDDAWEMNKPFTACPPVGNVIRGGKVTVNNVHLPMDPQHYKINCIWQLKPIPDSDLQIYVRVDKLIGSNASVKIHRGHISSSPLIDTISVTESSRNFTSNKGFYIELSKPANSGSFIMTHGVYKTLKNDEQCVFKVDGQSVEGFKCKENNFCIPRENQCNGLRDCPDGSDELSEMCETIIMAKSHSATASSDPAIEECPRGRCKDGRCPKNAFESCPEKPCERGYKRCEGTLLCIMPHFESCPGSGCDVAERTCADGSCIFATEDCPDGSGCAITRKTCSSGKCVGQYERCPEDNCPSYEPVKCDGECLYKSKECDGYKDCSDGSDEKNCVFGGGMWKILVIALVILPTAGFSCFIWAKCCPGRNPFLWQYEMWNVCCGDEDEKREGEEGVHMNPDSSQANPRPKTPPII